MVSCAEFLRDFSDYRDGCMGPAESASMEAHLWGCVGCAGYVRVLDEGIEKLRSLPAIEPSFDFVPRLQHRLYHLEDEAHWWSRGDTSGASLGFVLTLVVLIAGAAWLPIARPKAPLVELPPVAAVAPEKPAEIHALFRVGPLLTPSVGSQRVSRTATNTLFFRYTPLGSYTGYQPPSSTGR